MSTIPAGKLDKLASDAAAFWENDLGADFTTADGLNPVQFKAKSPSLTTSRDELAAINADQTSKSEEVDDKEEDLLQSIVNLRKTVEVKFGKNSRQYLNAPKIPRYPAKKKTDTGSGTS